MSAASIPEALEAEVLERAARGESSAAIAEWLRASKGVEVTDRTVRRTLRRRRIERADIAKTVVREKLAKTLVSDLDRLEELRSELARRRGKAAKSTKRRGEWCKLVELEVKILDRKLHYSGAGEPDAPAAAGTSGPVILIPPETDE